jgi:hypothetical protein
VPAFNDLRWAFLAKFGVFWTGLGTVLGTVSGTELATLATSSQGEDYGFDSRPGYQFLSEFQNFPCLLSLVQPPAQTSRFSGDLPDRIRLA